MGITPLFYRLLPGAQPLEMLAQRLIWSIPLYYSFDSLLKIEHDGAVLQDKRSVLCVYLAQWLWQFLVYVYYALTHQQVLEASLGYFINPLFSILLGMIFLKKSLIQQKNGLLP